MASVNKTIILGNLGKDPEVRYTPNGTAVCQISVATTRNWKNRDSGEKQEETEWHRLVAYDRLAEVIGEYVHKGDPIYVEGRLKTRKWQDKEGIERYTTEIIVESMQLLGGRNKEGGDGAGEAPRQRSSQEGGRQQSSATRSQGGQNGGRSTQQQRQPQHSATGFDDMDDDIPF